MAAAPANTHFEKCFFFPFTFKNAGNAATYWRKYVTYVDVVNVKRAGDPSIVHHITEIPTQFIKSQVIR